MAPTHPGPQQPDWLIVKDESCSCTEADSFEEPLMEVREYTPLPGNPQGEGTLNKGVRTLSRINLGQILGEYRGDIAPKTADDELGDNVY